MDSQQTFEKIYLELGPDGLKVPDVDPELQKFSSLELVNKPSYEQYRDWHNTVGRPYNWHTRARINNRPAIEELLAKDGTEMCLLNIQGVTVGYSLTETDDDGRVEISDFGFSPEEVGKGYGSVFFPLLVQRLLDQGVKDIWLSTRSTNDPRVVGFYEKFGFVVCERETVATSQH